MKHRTCCSLVMSVAILAGAATAMGQSHASMNSGNATAQTTSFRNNMRKLWEDHITWTRLYIVSALAGLPDTNVTAKRLLQNQSDIGNAMKQFYGDAAGEKLTALLKDHILIAADLIAGAKSGDTARSTRATARWNSNADGIAEFLSSANPSHWPAGEMKAMMHEHLSATTAEVVARLTHDWEGDIRAYDNVHTQILGMADMLSGGIIAQFPAKFN